MSNGTKYIGAIDQGTTSTRFIIFNEKSDIIAVGQKEHKQIYPQPGWCEHDPMEILANTKEVVEIALNKANLAASDLSAIGITNQRETTMVWDKATGLPVYNAIVWHDGRTSDIVHRLERMEIEVDDMDVHDEDVEITNDKRTLITGQNRFRKQAGLPLATYFSISKLMWIFENVEGVKEKALNGDALFGTMDTWLIWCLTGGKDGGLHITDVTNASRTMLMNLESLKWDPLMITKVLLPNGGVSADNVPFLPEIRSSSEVYGKCSWDILKDVPIAGNLGDQQAAFVGQCCFHLGNVKNTYGTGCFLMMNTGNVPVQSKNGLLTTVGFKFGDKETVYALEGSVAVAGALVQWLRDNMGLIKDAPEIEKLALTVEDNGGVYFVPAFAGLFAPYWDTSARGVIAGMTAYCTKAHIARAVLEATAFQSMEVVEAMQNDCRSNEKGATEISKVKVDGGMIANETLMQFQADILNIEVERPVIAETTALGAAYAAGLAVGVYKDLEELEGQWKLDKTWTSTMEDQVRDTTICSWKKAVQKSLGWVDESEPISKM